MSAHTILLVLAWAAVAVIVLAGAIGIWAVGDALYAKSRSGEQQLARLARKLSREAVWVCVPRHHLPADLGAVSSCARTHGYRLLGIERSRGPLRRAQMVFIAANDHTTALLYPQYAAH